MAFISATSKYLPEKVVANSELEQFPANYRALIAEKAGVLERRHVTGECTSDLGAKAVALLLEKTALDPLSVDALICATSSPDRMQPPTATRIQHLCSLSNAFAFDVNAVCCGSIAALNVAAAFITSGLTRVIVVASEVYSKILNPSDITTFPYFGDGAAAALLTGAGNLGIADSLLHSDGSGSDLIQVAAGGTMLPSCRATRKKDLYFTMDGKKVFEFACARGEEVIGELIRRNNAVPDRVILHQANMNIIDEIARRTKIGRDRFFSNVDRYGNTAGASVLIALDESLQAHASDKTIFLVAFGGGLSWGGMYLKRTAGNA